MWTLCVAMVTDMTSQVPSKYSPTIELQGDICMPTPLNTLLCNLPSFRKHCSNKKPFRASLKLQLVYISFPTTVREVCPRLVQSGLRPTLHTRYNLLQNLPVIKQDKYSNVHSPQTSNRQQRGALRIDQHRDQLLQGYEARVWMADVVRTRSCGEQLGSEHPLEMQ